MNTMNIQLDYQNAYSGSAFYPSESEVLTVLNIAKDYFDFNGDIELTIRIVNNEEQQELNKTYRQKDYPTNILSFPFDDELPDETIELLGDMIIAVDVVAKEALEQNKKIEHHWAHLIVHGFLHLLGYDHLTDEEAEEMESLEIEILKKLNIENPYLEK